MAGLLAGHLHTLWAQTAPTWVSGGTGTIADPYVITDPLAVDGLSILAAMIPTGRGNTRGERGTYFSWTVPTGQAGTWKVELDSTPDHIDYDIYDLNSSAQSRTGGGDETYDSTNVAVGDVEKVQIVRYGNSSSQSSTSGTTALTLTLGYPNNAAPVVTALATSTLATTSTTTLNVAGGGTVWLDGTATDPEGDSLTYQWKHGPEGLVKGTFADATALDTTWTAPAYPGIVSTNLIFLSVADGTSTTTSEKLEFTIVPGNSPPTVTITTGYSYLSGGGVLALDGTASDSDSNDTLTYAWTSDGGGTFASSTSIDTTWTAPAATGSQQYITLTLTVSDGTDSTSATASITIDAETNVAPTASVSASPTTVDGGATVTLDGTAADSNSFDTLTYAWTSSGGGTFGSSTSLDTTWVAPAATTIDQTVTITLTVTDGTASASATASITISASTTPTASVSASPTTVEGGGTVTLDGTAADADGDSLTYAWTSSGGGTFADSTALDTTWVAPAATTTDQTVTITLTVTDGTNSVTATESITVNELGDITVSLTGNPKSVDAGGQVVLDGTAADTDGSSLTYQWTSSDGGSFADATALDTTWTAPSGLGKTQLVTLTLTAMATADQESQSATLDITVKLLEAARRNPGRASESDSGLLPVGETFPDDPDNPHFWHGAQLWIIVSLALIFTIGPATKSPTLALLAGIGGLSAGIVAGGFSPLLVGMLVLEGIGAVGVFTVFKR